MQPRGGHLSDVTRPWSRLSDQGVEVFAEVARLICLSDSSPPEGSMVACRGMCVYKKEQVGAARVLSWLWCVRVIWLWRIRTFWMRCLGQFGLHRNRTDSDAVN